MNKAVFVNWYDEELDKYYKNDRPDNEGLIYGIYLYENEDDFHCEAQWYKTEKIREKNFKKYCKNFKLV